MSVAVDTNVVVAMVAGDAQTVERAVTLMQEIGGREALLLCPIVYAELRAHPGWGAGDIDTFLRDTDILVDWDLAPATWSRAGMTFSVYARRRARSRGGAPRRLMADFLIGAHAESVGGLVTADRSFFSTNFPALRLLTA
jgi:predicted nucleic acid-binding protein